MTFSIHNGQLRRDGHPFIAVGVTYRRPGLPTPVTTIDPMTLKTDFGAIAEAGFNTVRLPLVPAAGADPTGRADLVAWLWEALEIAREVDLAVVVALSLAPLDGGGAGTRTRPGRRDTDPFKGRAAFARQLGRALRGADNLMAVQLADDAGTGVPAAVAAPARVRLARMLRQELPGVLVTQPGTAGADPAPDQAAGPGGGLVAVHGCPIEGPGGIESALSYKATTVVAFRTQLAALHGAPLVDELGVRGVNTVTLAAYLRAAAASTLANGAAGVLAGSWTPAPARPSTTDGRERGGARPAPPVPSDELRQVATVAARLAGGWRSRRRARVALYLPDVDSGHCDVDDAGGFLAYLLLKRAHLEFDVVDGPTAGYRLVICPSVSRITDTDLARLQESMDSGAVVYYSMRDHLRGFPGSELCGVELVDFSLLPDGKSAIRWGDDRWPVDWRAARARPATLALTTAAMLAEYPDGSPAVTVRRFGPGQFVFCAAPYECQLDSPGRLAARPWEELYRRLAGLAGIVPALQCSHADVEVVPDRADPPRWAALINHGSGPVQADLTWRGDAEPVPVALAAKQWRVVNRDGTVAAQSG